MSNDVPFILLVEDNDPIRHAFRILLEDGGYRVEEASTGEAAIRAARSDRPDLILMDLGLPDMSGLDVTRTLKSDPSTRDAVIIAITGRALETDQNACLAAGCDSYLAKPVDTEKLFRTMAERLGGRS